MWWDEAQSQESALKVCASLRCEFLKERGLHGQSAAYTDIGIDALRPSMVTPGDEAGPVVVTLR
ncbi:hypothetical protein AWC02_14990 [Mycolicibacter engbaekii]|uniref:Uncharacterized protein n=1 Tax=Mycolicibacter engbaekii TaxID=188915 RepID=A0A1X1TI41_9MYCO|nr:hypothetical protein AWC02_14990 [Mycolicibacter engbaekii]